MRVSPCAAARHAPTRMTTVCAITDTKGTTMRTHARTHARTQVRTHTLAGSALATRVRADVAITITLSAAQLARRGIGRARPLHSTPLRWVGAVGLLRRHALSTYGDALVKRRSRVRQRCGDALVLRIGACCHTHCRCTIHALSCRLCVSPCKSPCPPMS
jgi:hypothetical protein